MGGSSSVRGDQTIYHTDNMCFDGTDRGSPMSLNGQLWIGATASDRADNGGHVRLGSLTSPGGTLTIGYAAPNITIDLAGGSKAIDSIAVQTGTSPVVPDGAGLLTFNGAVVAAGTNPVRTDGTGANTLAIEVQTSQALAAADATKIGLSNFNSAMFGVDANGFVSANSTTSASLTVSADGTYVLAVDFGGNALAGTFYISTQNVANRAQSTILAVSSYLNDTHGVLSVLANDVYNGASNVVMSDFRLAVDNGGNNVLLVTIGNRNGGNPIINVTWVGSYANTASLFPAALPPYTTFSYAGFDQIPREAMISTFKDTLTTSVVTAFSIQHDMATGNSAGNNIGTRMNFNTMTNNGTVFTAANLYTKTPNAATNVATSNFAIQTNNAGSLADSFTLTGAGVPAFPQAPLPVGSGGLGITTTPSNGQIPIGNGTNYTAANITSTGGTVTVTNGAGTINLETAAGGMAVVSTGSNVTNMAVNTRYVLTQGAATLTLGLPTTATVGQVIEIVSAGVNAASLWQITQAASQVVHNVAASSTVGAAGTTTSNERYASVKIVCVVANNEWTISSLEGTVAFA